HTRPAPPWIVATGSCRPAARALRAGDTSRVGRWSQLLASLEPLQLLAHALAQPAHGPLGTAQLLANLLGRVALQAQLDDGTLVRVQPAQQLLDRFGQDRSLLGRRLPAGSVAQEFGVLFFR